MAENASASAPASTPAGVHGHDSRYTRMRRRIVTPQAIYGTLLVAAIIGTAADEASDRDVLITTLGTVIVFWIAHVFAEAIAHYGTKTSLGLPLSESLRHSLHGAAGLLYSALLPCVFLLLGALGVLGEATAYRISLLLPVGLLAALGWLALADRGSPVWGRVLGALVTGLLGVFVILLKIAFH
ncbi:hypothetical protein KPL76_00590 [Subtercola sp. PAMC28395]|uniref:hypothetical protein n=1 Tax=Subtercola sp. PAMC28395 TaxID=2846775 RepID=UPI001C0AB0DD|nr:hypothetical protein [Subtercola sp. PAMC28395]QWT23985.1 hypothetical protein KPL76_00590 [Subtercola sp. PAMC28395]